MVDTEVLILQKSTLTAGEMTSYGAAWGPEMASADQTAPWTAMSRKKRNELVSVNVRGFENVGWAVDIHSLLIEAYVRLSQWKLSDSETLFLSNPPDSAEEMDCERSDQNETMEAGGMKRGRRKEWIMKWEQTSNFRWGMPKIPTTNREKPRSPLDKDTKERAAKTAHLADLCSHLPRRNGRRRSEQTARQTRSWVSRRLIT